MSYILDALKKSQEQRMRHMPQPPVMPDAGPERSQRRLLTWGMLALLTAAGLIGLKLQPHQPGSQDASQPEAESTRTKKNAAPAAERPKPAMQEGARSIALHGANAETAALNAGPAPEASPRVESAPRSLTSGAAMPMHGPQPEPQAAPSVKPREAAAGRTNRRIAETMPASLPRKADLAADMQARIPEISIQAHVYDPEPGARMIIVDGSIYHEGEPLPGGMKLEAITPEGIVASLDGLRFRLNTFGR